MSMEAADVFDKVEELEEDVAVAIVVLAVVFRAALVVV